MSEETTEAQVTLHCPLCGREMVVDESMVDIFYDFGLPCKKCASERRL